MRALISILMLNGFCISALACFTSVLSRSVDNKHLNKPNLNICMTVLYERISMLWRRIGDKYRLLDRTNAHNCLKLWDLTSAIVMQLNAGSLDF